MLFAPKIFAAMMDEVYSTTLVDFTPPLMSLGKVVGVLAVLGSGNLLTAGIAYWVYRKFKANQEAQQ